MAGPSPGIFASTLRCGATLLMLGCEAKPSLEARTLWTLPGQGASFEARLRLAPQDEGLGRRARSVIWVGRVAQPVAHEVEGEDDEHHRQDREQQPGMELHGGEVLRLVEEHAPARHRRPQPEA